MHKNDYLTRFDFFILCHYIFEHHFDFKHLYAIYDSHTVDIKSK